MTGPRHGRFASYPRTSIVPSQGYPPPGGGGQLSRRNVNGSNGRIRCRVGQELIDLVVSLPGLFHVHVGSHAGRIGRIGR